MRTREVQIGAVKIGGGNPLVLIAGPCIIESAEGCMDAARQVKAVAAAAGMPLIFKASFDKANRSSISSFRGPGVAEGLSILKAIRSELNLPILTDIHDVSQCEPAAEAADVLQIPAFLCRQTDLLYTAGKTGRPINVKKGQFLSPGDMRNVIEKIKASDNEEIILTERGTCFGYHYLVNDMRALPAMRMLGYPVVFDGTHSVQTPGGMGSRSGGERHYVPTLTRSAIAAGVDGVFLEVHPDPDKALSDGPNMLRIDELSPLLQLLQRIHETVRATVEAEGFERADHAPSGRTLINAAAKLPPQQ